MHTKEIKFIFNSKKSFDKESFALAKSLNNYVINELDVSKNKLTPTQLAQWAHQLGLPVHQLLNKENDVITKSYSTFTEEDVLKIINQDMSRLITPIMFLNGEGKIVKTPFDFHAFDLEVMGINSK